MPAAARAGAIAPCDVTVPAQNTGLGPEKTSFFQALGITTKISRGTIEILVRLKDYTEAAGMCINIFCITNLMSFFPQSDVSLIKTGDKVGASEATLLNMLNISPFSYGLLIQQVYDNGSVYSPEVLDITEASLHARFLEVRFSTCKVLDVEDTHSRLLFALCSVISVSCFYDVKPVP